MIIIIVLIKFFSRSQSSPASSEYIRTHVVVVTLKEPNNKTQNASRDAHKLVLI